MANNSLRERYFSLLMERLEETSYPSVPMMDQFEAGITDLETAQTYVSALLDRVEEARYPSPPCSIVSTN
jgi:hypothetical protein